MLQLVIMCAYFKRLTMILQGDGYILVQPKRWSAVDFKKSTAVC